MAVEIREERYRRLILPHSSAAYNLARWLLSHPQDAEDVTQEAFLKAYRSLDRLRGEYALPWLLAIVRNECYDWLKRTRASRKDIPYDLLENELAGGKALDEEVIGRLDAQRLQSAMEELPTEYREVILLRCLQGLSYKQISEIIQVPIGTVMSRLSRARERMQKALETKEGEVHGKTMR